MRRWVSSRRSHQRRDRELRSDPWHVRGLRERAVVARVASLQQYPRAAPRDRRGSRWTRRMPGVPARRANGEPIIASVDYPPARPLRLPTSMSTASRTSSLRSGLSVMAANRSGMLPGFPATIPRPPEQTSEQQAVVGDVDGDGKLEIVVAERSGSSNLAAVYVFECGSLRAHLGGRLIVRRRRSQSRRPGRRRHSRDPAADPGQDSCVAGRWARPVAGWPVSLGENAGGGPEVVVGDLSGDGLADVAAVAGEFFSIQQHLAVRIQSRRHAIAGLPKAFDAAVGGIVPAIMPISTWMAATISSLRRARCRAGATEFSLTTCRVRSVRPDRMGTTPQRFSTPGCYESGKNLPDSAYLTTLVHGAGRVPAAGGGIDCGLDCIERMRRERTSRSLLAPMMQPRSTAGWARARGKAIHASSL